MPILTASKIVGKHAAVEKSSADPDLIGTALHGPAPGSSANLPLHLSQLGRLTPYLSHGLQPLGA